MSRINFDIGLVRLRPKICNQEQDRWLYNWCSFNSFYYNTLIIPIYSIPITRKIIVSHLFLSKSFYYRFILIKIPHVKYFFNFRIMNGMVQLFRQYCQIFNNIPRVKKFQKVVHFYIFLESFKKYYLNLILL